VIEVPSAIKMGSDPAPATQREAIIAVIVISSEMAATANLISRKGGADTAASKEAASIIGTVKLSAVIIKIIRATGSRNATTMITLTNRGSTVAIMTGARLIRTEKRSEMITLITRVIENLTLTTDVVTVTTTVVAVEVAIGAVATSSSVKKTTRLSLTMRSSCQSPKATKTQTKSVRTTSKKRTKDPIVGATAAEAVTRNRRHSPKINPLKRPQKRQMSSPEAF